MSAVLQASESGHHIVNELPLPPIMFGVIAFLTFLVLLGFLFSFRKTLQVDGSAQGQHHDSHGAADTKAAAGRGAAVDHTR